MPFSYVCRAKIRYFLNSFQENNPFFLLRHGKKCVSHVSATHRAVLQEWLSILAIMVNLSVHNG